MRQIRAVGLGGLIAMTVLSVAIAAPIASAKTTPARANLVKAVGTSSAQAKKLIARAATCPAAAAQRKITTKVRAAQTKRLAKASPTSLRLRQLRITTHTQRLAVALTKCSGGAGPGTGTPGSGGTGRDVTSLGSGGANGSSGQPGTNSAGIPLNIFGDTLDAGGLLNGGTLPGQILDVGVASLATAPACTTSGAVCVGVDSQALNDALTSAVAERVKQLPVLGAVLNPLLAQVNAILAATGPESLISVTRNGDTSLTVNAVPGTPLAGILNLLNATGGVPSTSVATLQVHL